MTASADPVIALLSDEKELPNVRVLICRIHSRAPYLLEAEDFFQEVMVRSLASRGQFTGTSKGELFAWIQTIARRCLVDRVRKAARRPAPRALPDALADANSTPVDEAIVRHESVAAALRVLTPLEGTLLQARYEGGLSFE